MQKIKISSLIDGVFKYTATFFLFFIWIRYFVDNLIFAIFISLLSAFFVIKIIESFVFSKNVKTEVKKELKKDIDSYMLSLYLNSDEENLEFFYSILKKDGAVKENGFIVQGTRALLPIFNKSEISFEEILKPLMRAKKLGYNKIIICCNSCKISSFKLDGISLEVLEKEAVFLNIFSKYEVFPEVFLQNPKNKISVFKLLLKNIISKGKAKSYFLFAIVTFVFSYFVMFRIYYLIACNVFLLFAIICLFNKKATCVKQNIWE